MEQERRSHHGILFLIIILIVVVGYAWYANKIPFVHSASDTTTSTPDALTQSPTTTSTVTPVATAPLYASVTHIATPSTVNGIYISSWSAGTASSMTHIDGLLAGGKLNTVVVDIKDATGRISYKPLDPSLVATGAGTNRISNLPALIQSLHARHIYIIGRIEVFQDQYYATIHPEDALQDTITHSAWKDPKGLMYLQPNNTDVWHYTESIAEDAYAQGFDEINLDYVRFPSDGTLDNIDESTFTKSKEDTIADFFTNIDTTLRQQDHIIVSADIFGLTMSATNDMGIGQKLELIAPHVDYVCPMIYPSHFANGTYGYAQPAEYPYDMIHKSLTDGMAKLTTANIATAKLRPWLQDFNLGAVYTSEMIQSQITATNDMGLQSWLFWDPKNLYTASVFK